MRSFGLRSLLLGVLLAFSSSAIATDLVIEDQTQNTLNVHRGVTAALPARTSPALAEGTLRVIHSDNFRAGKGSYQYQVHSDAGKVTALKVSVLPPSILSGQRVIVQGQRVATSLQPQRITIMAAPLRTQAATSNRVLVILANFSNTAAPAFSQAQAQQVMASVGQFFADGSYGAQTLNVTVTPWLTTTVAAGPCDFTAIGNAADTAAAAWNPQSYPFIVYLFPRSPCGWAGLAYVGWGRAWINGDNNFGLGVVAHEMGHNFGLLHAGSVDVAGVREYGDPWSTMGAANGQHYNARQKEILGWIPAASVKTHTSGTATYSLDTLEDAGGTTYAVRIPTSSPLRTYYVESRRATPGAAQIRLVGPFEQSSGSDDSQVVLDGTPLQDGQQFIALDVTITVGAPPPPPPPPGPNALANGSFEIPALGGGLRYKPAGATWTFVDNSGIQGNGSAFGAAAAPNGKQTAFVQALGSMAQTLNLNVGSYTLTFQAARRSYSDPANSVQPVKVTLDGVQIGNLIAPTSTSFAAFSIPFAVATSGPHTLKFEGTDPKDKTTFIDDVRIQ